MPDDRRRQPSREPVDEQTRAGPTEPSDSSGMRARTWAIAYLYRTPADYGIPPLPEWTVERTAGGGIAFAAGERSEAFIRADRPATVRR